MDASGQRSFPFPQHRKPPGTPGGFLLSQTQKTRPSLPKSGEEGPSFCNMLLKYYEMEGKRADLTSV